MVQLKYAPNDAPYTGKGRWSWPLTLIEDQNTIEKIIKRGIQLQNDINEYKANNVDRNITNPQILWETFKTETKKIAQSQSKKTYHKITTKIRNLEIDRAALSTHPDFDIRDDLRTSEAMIASELTHLEKAQANDNSDTFKARLHAQGERPGRLWSKLGKSQRPRDLIHRLKILNMTPPQYERHSKKMSRVARDYHENLQNEGLDQNQNPEEHKNKTKTFLNHIPDEQRITE